MTLQQLRRIQLRLPADRVEQIRRQCQVDHLLDEDAADRLGGVRVALRVERVESAEIGRQGGVFQFDRPLKVLAKAVERFDPCCCCLADMRHFVVIHGFPISGAGGMGVMPMLPTCVTGWSEPSNATVFTAHFPGSGKDIADRPLVKTGQTSVL